MKANLPARPIWLWLAGSLLWFGIIPILFYDSWLYYAEGGRSPDGPGMLLAGAIPLTIVFLPLWALFLASFLFRYDGGGSAFAWRTRSPTALLLSGVAVLGSGLALFIVLRMNFWWPSRLPYAIYWLAWAAFFQLLRAAAVKRSLGSHGAPLK